MLKKLLSVLLMISVTLCLLSCNKKTEQPQKLSTIMQSFGSSGPNEVNLTEKLSFAKRIDGEDGYSWSMQGGANDGKFGYFIMNEHPEEGRPRSRIYKIDLTSWEIVMISDDLDLGHGNDVTYMPKDNQLIVTLCESPGYGAVVVDADSLKIVDSINYPLKHPCMTYSPQRDQYVFAEWGNNDNLAIYNGKLELVKEIENKINFAEQGIACDDEFIYFLESPNSGGSEGYILVYNWDGEFQFIISFPIAYEVENISVFGNKLILAANDHKDTKMVYFYEVTFE